ncbi:hypothetical protein D3C81_1263400 [compost metagenome]
MVADAWVGADALAHHLDIGTEHFRKVGHFIHEADFCSQHAVGGVLGQLCATHIHDDDLFMVAIEGGV